MSLYDTTKLCCGPFCAECELAMVSADSRIIKLEASLAELLAERDKCIRSIPTIPAWKCPSCGTCHPITVRTCCQPIDKTMYPPPMNPWGDPLRPPPPYEYPIVTCKGNKE